MHGPFSLHLGQKGRCPFAWEAPHLEARLRSLEPPLRPTQARMTPKASFFLWRARDGPKETFLFLLRARMNLLDLYEINFTVSENPLQKRKKSAISMATKARAANATVLGGLQRQRYRTLSLGAHRLLASRFGGPVPCPMGCDARIPNRIVHSCTYKSPRTLAIHTEAQEFPSARVTLAQERAQA